MGMGHDMTEPTKARIAVAENVDHLMKHYQHGFNVGIDANQLSKRIGIHAKTIKRLLNPRSGISVTLVTLDAIASFFQIETWQLLQPKPKTISFQTAESSHRPNQHRSAK